jgi:PleD family two-component response regulator
LRVPEGTTFPAELTLARILLVDDELSNVQLLRRLLLSHGFTRLAETTDPLQAMSLFESFDPDLVCLDLHMSPLDGFGCWSSLHPEFRKAAISPF